MRKILAVFAVFIGLVGFAACGNDHSNDSTSSFQPSSTPSHDDSTFLSTLRDGNSDFDTAPDGDLLTLAHGTCTLLDKQPTSSELRVIMNVLVNNGIPAYDAGYLVGASVAYYCPSHTDLIEQFAQQELSS